MRDSGGEKEKVGAMNHLSTVAAFGFDDFDSPVILDLYRQLGCTSCQFYRNPTNPPTTEDAIRITRDVGLPIDSIHGLFGDQHDPACPDGNIRRAAIATYQAEAELAVQLGGPMVVVHPSPFAPKGHDILPGERNRRVDPLRRSMVELARIGEQMNVTFLFENNPDFAWIGHDPLQLADIIREVASPNIRMCFDTGHANMTGSVCDRLALCADVISYLHISDNDGQTDAHQLPGRGTIDWRGIKRTLLAAKRQVPAMLELFYSADELRQFIADGVGDQLTQWLNAPSPGAVHSRHE